jgi:microcystin-dependent protein
MASTYTTNYNLAKPAHGDVDWHIPINGNWDKIDSSMKNIANRTCPTGSIIMYGAATAPAGWLECNGDAVSRTTYSALFSVIGTTYGSGDGTTTFNLPDLRGEFIRGWDHGRGVDKNRIFGSTQEDEIKSHNHSLRYTDYWQAGGSGSAPSYQSNVSEYRISTNTIQNTGGTETRPRNVALIYIIKT